MSITKILYLYHHNSLTTDNLFPHFTNSQMKINFAQNAPHPDYQSHYNLVDKILDFSDDGICMRILT